MAYQQGNNTLTNNFRANLWILFLSMPLLALLSYLNLIPSLANFKWVDFKLAGVFVVAYFFTSLWFSPDLDIRVNRPGKGTFPLRHTIRFLNKQKKKMPIIGAPLGILAIALEPIHLIFNRIWWAIWTPFSHLVTHRGIVHFPIIGTQLKILWVFSIYYVGASSIQFLASYFSVLAPLAPSDKSGYYESILNLYTAILEDRLLTTAYIAAMIADIAHSSIDAWDSWKKGSKFVPPAIIAPRGLLYKVSGGTVIWAKKRLFG